MVAMKRFLQLPGRAHSVGLGLHREAQALSRHRTAVRPAGRTAAFPKAKGNKRPVCHGHTAAATFSGPACGGEGNPTGGFKGSLGARLCLCSCPWEGLVQMWKTSAANKQPRSHSWIETL